jgi:hypothetical protein
MSTRFAPLAVALLTVLLGASATAQASLSLPPVAPLPLPPAPHPEPDEYARRSWELFPQVGGGAPFCRGDSFGFTHCGDTGGGTSFGAGALYRLTPFIALGLEANFANFQTSAIARDAYSRTSWLGFVARGYFFERGAFDPYIETGMGRGGAVAFAGDDQGGLRLETSGPSALAGVGVDFWVLPYLRIGPAISYRWTWLTDVRSCLGSVCQPVEVKSGGGVGSYATLSLVATIALGREM